MKTIVFLGGSITLGAGAENYEDSYAARVSEWLKGRYGSLTVINLGSHGTNSEFALFRLKRQLKGQIPDIIFLEFAVNDRVMEVEKAAKIFENLLRYLFLEYPSCLFMTFELPMEGFQVMDELHEQIAGYYGIPSINVNQTVRREILEKIYCWSDISVDQLHPNDKGHEIYASKIIESLEQTDLFAIRHTPEKAPLYGGGWFNPEILPPKEGVFMGSWTLQKSGYVNKVEALAVSKQAGDFFELAFQGNMLALAVKMTADSGKLYCILDEEQIFGIDCYSEKEQFLFAEIAEELSDGNHILYARLEERMPERAGNKIYIGGFGINRRPNCFEGFLREKTDKKLSIIAACKGERDSLLPFLEALAGQTIKQQELELILVDSGCSFKCREELSEFEKKYPEFVCLIQAESGMELSACFNLGLSYASGEYVLFLQEQDFLYPDACLTLLKTAQDTGADLIQTEWNAFWNEEVPFSVLRERRQILQSVYGEIDCQARGKLIQRSLIEKAEVCFQEGARNGELMFVYPLLFYADCVVRIEGPFWKKAEKGPETESSYDLSVRDVLFYLCRKGFYAEFYQEICLFFLVRYFIKGVKKYCSSCGEQEFFDKISIMREIVSAYFPDFDQNPYLQEKKFAALKELLFLLQIEPGQAVLKDKKEEWRERADVFLKGLKI